MSELEESDRSADTMQKRAEPIPETKVAEKLIYLQNMYKEQCDQARQHENLRHQSTSLVITISGAMATLAAATSSLTFFMAPPTAAGYLVTGGTSLPGWIFLVYSLLGFFIIGLSQHGKKLSIKHYERNRMHTERARQYRLLMEGLFERKYGKDARRNAVREFQGEQICDKNTKKVLTNHLGYPRRTPGKWQLSDAGRNYPHMVDVQLYDLWLGIFRFTTLVGGFLALLPCVIVTWVYKERLTSLIH